MKVVGIGFQVVNDLFARWIPGNLPWEGEERQGRMIFVSMQVQTLIMPVPTCPDAITLLQYR